MIRQAANNSQWEGIIVCAYIPALDWMFSGSPTWILMWRFRWSERPNAFPHTRHLYGFSPLWILLCTRRSHDRANRLLQTVHSYGFSPECLRRCSVNTWLLRKHFPHSGHWYLLLWMYRCVFKLWRIEKVFPHWGQEYTFCPVCSLLCTDKPSFLVNRLSQTTHTW